MLHRSRVGAGAWQLASASGWPYNKPLVINHQMDAPRAQEMAVLKNSTTQITDWRHKLQYRLKEGALIALGAMCLYLLMALLTYNVADPAWDNSVQVERIMNAENPGWRHLSADPASRT